MLLLTLFLGFLLGALTVVAAEAFGLVFLIARLSRRTKKKEEEAALRSSQGLTDLDPSLCNKQGALWILESKKVPKPSDKPSKDKKGKKEFIEVNPVKVHAKISGHSLILTESDDSCKEIKLKECQVVAVSASELSSRKWAKRYPIKVESRNSILYNGNKSVYIYLENSWEKESWCKALRFASCDDIEKLGWFSDLSQEFRRYLATLNTAHPTFMKPSTGNNELTDKTANNSSSKIRFFFKKLARKASKGNVENKNTLTSTVSREEKKTAERSRSFQDTVHGNNLVNNVSTRKVCEVPNEDKIAGSSSQASLSRSDSKSDACVSSDVDNDDKIISDEGTLCLNLLLSRLFFDVKNNADTGDFVQKRVQRMLSNMRIPNFMGDVNCVSVKLGQLAPHIHGMRVIPLDMNEVWAIDIDIEYSGGAGLNIETRLEVHEPDFQKGIIESNFNPSSEEDVNSDLLESFENYGKQFEASEDKGELTDVGDSKQDGTKSSKSSNKGPPSASRWKSIINTIAKQVSQVPIQLAIRIVSFRGTLRLHIKPPPTDQLWFGFTSMPDIDFNLDSSVGDRKITSGHVALFLISRFKAAIRATLVLPNCECVSFPWMLAEKDDWVPRKDSPYMWLNNQETNDRTGPPPDPSTGSQSTRSNFSLKSNSSLSQEEHDDHPSNELQVDSSRISSHGNDQLCSNSSSSYSASTSDQTRVRELKVPLLLTNNETQYSNDHEENQDRSIVSEGQGYTMGGDYRDQELRQPKRMESTKARMRGLGKRMTEKLEEKKRHIEEKGRNMVERMRGPN
ncbi:uncharacterized protein LOC124929525 [Impatiens glandulifera]|uniref:uncharacterized protein LOC124929525 n=1 Tax=Impatiens glandulifera TaxID=253017 RepID=UPI001FB14DD8|nr:uncharacterized protein LOC124929525 [Impatiens glandulifera]